MSIQSNSYRSETVVPLAPNRADGGEVDQLDVAGRSILSLLHKAADASEQNSKEALEMAQAFSQQLKDAEQQIAELQANARHHEDRADRAEQWLHKIYTEIDSRFVRQEAVTSHSSPKRRIQSR
jgi:flagellar hook-basal body complex protein FliE